MRSPANGIMDKITVRNALSISFIFLGEIGSQCSAVYTIDIGGKLLTCMWLG